MEEMIVYTKIEGTKSEDREKLWLRWRITRQDGTHIIEKHLPIYRLPHPDSERVLAKMMRYVKGIQSMMKTEEGIEFSGIKIVYGFPDEILISDAEQSELVRLAKKFEDHSTEELEKIWMGE